MSALVELGVPGHVVPDFFAEATSSMPHSQREAVRASPRTLHGKSEHQRPFAFPSGGVYASLVFVRSRVSFHKAVASSPANRDVKLESTSMDDGNL